MLGKFSIKAHFGGRDLFDVHVENDQQPLTPFSGLKYSWYDKFKKNWVAIVHRAFECCDQSPFLKNVYYHLIYEK